MNCLCCDKSIKWTHASGEYTAFRLDTTVSSIENVENVHIFRLIECHPGFQLCLWHWWDFEELFSRTNGFAKHRISVAIKRTHTQRKSNEDKRNCLAGKTVVNFLWCKRQEYSHQFVGTEKQKKASSCQENISKRFRLFNKNRKNESESETRWMLTNSKHACPTTPYT